MKKSKIRVEFIILGVIILALLAYLVFRNPDRIHYDLPEIDRVPEDEIAKIEIQKGGETIALERGEDQWLIQPQGYPVDPEKIGKIKSTVAGLALTDVISESESYSKYGLDEENRIAARVYDSKGIRIQFSIGKQAATYRHTYVKLRDDRRVFHARDSFRNDFDETVDSLRNKLVLNFDQSEIREIHLVKEDQTLVFSKNREKTDIDSRKAPEESGAETGEAAQAKPEPQEIWLLPNGRKGKQEELKSLVRDLSNLRCASFLDRKNKDDFTAPLYRIILKGNQEYTLEIFPKIDEADDSYPAHCSQSPYVFSLASYQAEKFMKKPEDLMVPEEKE